MPDSNIFFLILGVTGTVGAIFVWYQTQKHPDPRFRPRPHEVVILSLVVAAVCFGTSFGVSSFLRPDFDPKKKIKQEGEDSERMAWRGQGGGAKDNTEPGFDQPASAAEAAPSGPTDEQLHYLHSRQ